jgi:calcineurin-like phosphoesterase family protein
MISQLYEPFKHWSDGGSVYIIGDLHFGDSDCKLMAHNWISPREQVDVINSVVKKSDTLIVLGDVGDESYIDYIKTRRRVLITGNHDEGVTVYTDLFNEVYDGPLFVTPKLVISHEPVWLPFASNIHGHVHNGKKRYVNKFGCRCLNLAANVCGYVPANLGREIKNGLLASSCGIHRYTIDIANNRE